MVDSKTSLLLAGGFLAVFLGVQGKLIHEVSADMKEYAEPRPAASTHSFLYPETNPEAAVDGDPNTFWADRGGMAADRRNPPVLLPYDGLYLLFWGGMTHLAGKPPRSDSLSSIGIRSGASGAKFFDYARPKKIRLSFFEQQLYEINHDYRFPDQPVFVAFRDFRLEDRPDEQTLKLDFLPAPSISQGFPDQVKARWFRLEIMETYPGRARREAAISEIRMIRDVR